MAKKTVRKAAKKAATPPPPGSGNDGPPARRPLVTIRAHEGGEEPLTHVVMTSSGPAILNIARRWPYILRVRSRWAGDPEMRDYFAEQASNDLTKLGVSAADMPKFALASHIEVEVHELKAGKADTDRLMEAASEIPWEYLLTSATRNAGRFNPLLVTRCFSNGVDVNSIPPRQVLFVESAPGRIDQEYEFDGEETRIRAAVNNKMTIAPTLPLGKLKEKVASSNWEAIHVTGVDTHQAAWLIDGFYDVFEKTKPDEKPKTDVIDDSDVLHDGMILRGDTESEVPVRYDHLPAILLGSKKKPQVITLNLYYSGARTARELVRKGAHAAIGFLDEIDDEFAEQFFQAFYWAWCHDSAAIQSAFLDAWKSMDGDRMHGTGIVIWLGSSMIGFKASQKKNATKRTAKKRSGAQ